MTSHPHRKSVALFVSHIQTKNATWVIVYLFHTYLLSTCSRPGTIPGVRDTTMNKADESHCPRGAYILAEGDRQQGNKHSGWCRTNYRITGQTAVQKARKRTNVRVGVGGL